MEEIPSRGEGLETKSGRRNYQKRGSPALSLLDARNRKKPGRRGREINLKAHTRMQVAVMVAMTTATMGTLVVEPLMMVVVVVVLLAALAVASMAVVGSGGAAAGDNASSSVLSRKRGRRE